MAKLTPKEKAMNDILKTYRDLAKAAKAHPTLVALIPSGITRDKIRHHFGNMGGLRAAAQAQFPKVFEKINAKAQIKEAPHPLADFTKEGLGVISKENDFREGSFVITAAAPTSHLDWDDEQHQASENDEHVTGMNLFQEGFDSLNQFCKHKKAQLVILPMPAHVKALKKQPRHYDPRLKEYQKNFATEFTFNKQLKAIEAHINPQQFNPLTGMGRLRIHKYTDNSAPGEEIRRFKTSLIIGHAKQMMEVVPTGNSSHPRIVHSTGAITKPSYLRNRVGMIANEDHKLGALVVEIKGDVFWLRQIQFDPVDGSFVDLGKRYYADGRVEEERAEAFKLGDIHPGFEDMVAVKAIQELWGVIKPKKLFVEDFFDGSSISHHLEKKMITRCKLPVYFTSLEKELEYAKDVLFNKVLKGLPKDCEIYATASNHPEHVMRYLEEGRYIRDAVNHEIAHRMVVMAYDKKNPLKEYLDPQGIMKWTNENDDFYVEGVQMNVHGHLGLNGARGSKAGHERSYGNAMVAHSHTPSIFHDLFTVGHTTIDRHGYNNGASTWVLCSGAVYKRGCKQLYMVIKGKAFR